MSDQQGFTVPANFLRDMAEIKKVTLGSSRTRSSKFRRRRNPGADDTATIVGGLAVATPEDIDSPADQTWADVPEGVKDQVPGGDTIDSAAPCWKLESGDGVLYQLVAELDEDDEVSGIWMVPVSDGDTTLYNMAGQVTAGHALQVKEFTARIGGGTMKISLIDVEKC